MVFLFFYFFEPHLQIAFAYNCLLSGYFEFIKNNKYVDNLIVHDQIYKYIRKDGQKTLWECFKTDCTATCETSGGQVVVRRGLHNHVVATRFIMKKRKEGSVIKKKLV